MLVQKEGAELKELEFLQLLDSIEPGELMAADKVLKEVCAYIEGSDIPTKVGHAGRRAIAAAILIRYGAICAPAAEITMSFRNKDAAKETWRFFQDRYNQNNDT